LHRSALSTIPREPRGQLLTRLYAREVSIFTQAYETAITLHVALQPQSDSTIADARHRFFALDSSANIVHSGITS
ncbi:MAG TPA: hypothetical protein VJX47_09855, partial [Candidatus Sulfotelmatobacter sp.]|nr:hypothetical protein [Candidatus Sulfotelmatobacter sp.]